MLSKFLVTPAIIIALTTGGGTALKYYGDHTYVMQDSYQQGIIQQRTWSLQDQINAIRDKAADDNRKLTPREELKIQKLQDEIKRLGERG